MSERIFEARIIKNKEGQEEMECKVSLPVPEIPQVLGHLTATTCANVVEENVDLNDLDETASMTATFIWHTQAAAYFATMSAVAALLPEDKRDTFCQKFAQGIELLKERSLADFEAAMRDASATVH